MMKCSACGYENPDGSKFCSECGIKLERRCHICGEVVGVDVRFCPRCGVCLDSTSSASASGIAMGDKNVIAGDVYGSKEDYHISGNATIIKNTDDTKRIIVCSICGKHFPMSEGYTCPSCDNFVCSSCFNSEYGKCNDCMKQIRKKKEEEYTEILRKEISGPLSDSKLHELKDKGKKYELSEDVVSSLIDQVVKERRTYVRAFSISETEQEIINNAVNSFYENWNKETAEESLKKILLIYEQHKNDKMLINTLIPIYIKGDIEKARDFIKDISIDSPELYCARIDLALFDKNILGAINLVEDAKLSFPDNVQIKSKEIEVRLICGASLEPQQTFKAKALARNLQVEGSKLERSFAFHARLLAGLYCNDIIDKQYLRTQDLYTGYCFDGMNFVVGTIPICHYPTIKDALSACPRGGVISIIPGSYEENLILDKAVTIEAYNNTALLEKFYNIKDVRPVIKILNDLPVKVGDDIIIKNVTFTQTVVSEKNTDSVIVGKALFDIKGNCGFFYCRINNCRSFAMSITGSANPTINNCLIENAGNSGIIIFDNANPIIENTNIFRCRGNGIESRDKATPIVSDCIVINCTISGFRIKNESTGKYTNCISESNKENGFHISGNALPIFEKCIARTNESNGFVIDENSAGQYGLCTAEANKQDGFWVKGGANPVLENCIAKTNAYHGFFFCENATGQYRMCTAEANRQNGFYMRGKSDPVLEKCVAKVNEYHGFFLDENSTGQYKDCTAEKNKQNGFFVKGAADPLFEDCMARVNESKGFCFQGNSTGQYRYCEAESSTQVGFFVRGTANPVLKQCKAVTNNYAGFWLGENSTGQYIECIAESNKKNGFFVNGSANPTLEKCIARMNEYPGFFFCENATGQYRKCTAEANKEGGYCVKEAANPVLDNCLANANDYQGFIFDGNTTGQCRECIAEANKQEGFFVRGAANPVFEKCQSVSNSKSGFWVCKTADVQFTDCISKYNYEYGFHVENGAQVFSKNLKAKDNKKSNFSGLYADTDGIKSIFYKLFDTIIYLFSTWPIPSIIILAIIIWILF